MKRLVRDWMTADPTTVKPDTSVIEAYHLMIAQRIRRLPVVDEGNLVGIVTLSDLHQPKPFKKFSMSFLEMSDQLSHITVGEMMTPQPVTIDENTTLGQAAQKMLEHKISGLPVINSVGHLAGIITESDIFRLVVEEWTTRRHGSIRIPRQSGG